MPKSPSRPLPDAARQSARDASPAVVLVVCVGLALVGGLWMARPGWVASAVPGLGDALSDPTVAVMVPAMLWAVAGVGLGWLVAQRNRPRGRTASAAAVPARSAGRPPQGTRTPAGAEIGSSPAPRPAPVRPVTSGAPSALLISRLRHTLALAAAPGGDPFALVAVALMPSAPDVDLDLLSEAVARRAAPLLKPSERLVVWRDAAPSSPAPGLSGSVAPWQALVLLEELDADAHARLPARLRTWQQELSEAYTVADHPVSVRVALGVLDQPPVPLAPSDGEAARAALDPAAQACTAARAVAAAALAALTDADAARPRGLDPRSIDGIWFHAPAYDRWCEQQSAAERRWAAFVAPGGVHVRLVPVAALTDGTPAGWLAESILPASAGLLGQPATATEDEAAALVVDDEGAEAAAFSIDGSTVPLKWRRQLARTVWAQAMRALEARDPGARDTWVAVPVPEGLWLDDELLACITDTSLAAGQPASRLDLLLDERIAAARPEDIARQLQAVRATGARATLVGLTRGAGSLSRLAHLPLTGVRIDAALVHDLPLRETAQVLVRALVQLAAEHRQLVWAEAVAAPSQRRALRDAGVVWAQAAPSSLSDPAHRDEAERLGTTASEAPVRRSTIAPA